MNKRFRWVLLALFFTVNVSATFTTNPSFAQNVGIEKAAKNLKSQYKGIKSYYASVNYKPMFVGSKNSTRRNALIAALRNSDIHGLPTSSYQPTELSKALKSARTPADRGKAEMAAAKIFVRYAQNMSSGVLRPSSVDSEIALYPKKLSAQTLLAGMAKGSGKGYLKALEPKHSDYALLVKEMQRVKRTPGSNTPNIPLKTLKPGAKSSSVALMRSKLKALGMGNLGNSTTYDSKLVEVVKKFQKSRGLSADGVAGPATLSAMNGVSSTAKLEHLVANLERQRWLNFPRGKRHIYVNLPDFSVALYDNGKQSFYSRTVIGKRSKDTRSPEFVDKMTHMVINPTWHVPASIAGKEYLPIIKNDPGFLKRKNMTMLNQSGQAVNPGNIDLAAYTEDNFPYYIKQRPNAGNALGLVKFMFPNKYNIYLHDTPSKSLFNKDIRAFSHGCIRVHKPFEFAYSLLAKQSSNPKGLFHSNLDTKQEKYLNLKEPVPVIIGYQTVIFDGKSVRYRGDIYGRNAKITRALKNAGVAI